ncbi:hypothetical protein B0O99DRAFT_619655 [Bisporella sp. PMI_857]|nr:hypothetical protein B0O99DRAFT_619655 [Bisporella sp. PMI_857]
MASANMRTDIYEVTSSPPQPQFKNIIISSSPSLLSSRKSRGICLGGNAPISEFATASITTSSLLKSTNTELPNTKKISLKDAGSNGDGVATEDYSGKRPRKLRVQKLEDEKKVRMSRAKKVVEEATVGEATDENLSMGLGMGIAGTSLAKKDDAPNTRAVRKPRAKKVATMQNSSKEKAVRKPKVKKADAQAKFPKAQITKPDLELSVNKHFPTDHGKTVDLDKGLAEAVKRRSTWTPPKATDAAENPLHKSAEFANLLGSFQFNEGHSKRKINQSLLNAAGARKRKLIELVKTNSSSRLTSPEKPKTVKKKARTLTDLATSAYALEEEIAETGATSLLQYFSLGTMEETHKDGFKVPPKPRTKSPTKCRKGTADAPILLSPESAIKHATKQDFVFGTSSQLAREESPTFLRDIHAAMQASNEPDDPFADSLYAAALPGKEKSKLWTAAARDSDGALIEVLDMTKSSPVASKSLALLPNKTERCDVWRDIDEAASTTDRAIEEKTGISIEKRTNAPIMGKNSEPIEEQAAEISEDKTVGPIEAEIRELLSSPAGQKPTTLEKSTKTRKVPAKSSKPSKSQSSEMPKYESYTTAQLTKEVALYRFKPVKKREQMIALLEKCWESKQRMILGNLEANYMLSSPQKTVGTQKEKSKSSRSKHKAKNTVVEEISDSDTPATPSPPRPSQARRPLDLMSSQQSSLTLSPESTQTQLFDTITQAVTSCTPSKDPRAPSWHEKILLYDPIVLEDLTIWLNTGGLQQVGWDGEVDPKDVKKWCESKSICCLWRESLRNGSRNRY